jgi:hypothetical protein
MPAGASMLDDRLWWPLDLSPAEEEAVVSFREHLVRQPPPFDLPSLGYVARRLAAMMSFHVGDIIERDGLPHLSHLVNGWGNGRYLGQRHLDRIADFVHRDATQRPIILQCDPEGEFHPWQTFAYAVMAGVDADEALPGVGESLRGLTKNSRTINTGEGVELGHLLYALAYLDPDVAGRPFTLKGTVCDVMTLMELAVEAHRYGSFEVCRKFHLTEGLCAAASQIRGLEHFRGEAEAFLSGQLDMLFVLGAILAQVRRFANRGERPAPGCLLFKLRDSLALGNNLENHCYYAGHIGELASLATLCGYRIRRDHWSALAYVFNELDATLPSYFEEVSFLDCFLHLGHYRRAMTLLPEVASRLESGLDSRGVALDGYTVNFDDRYSLSREHESHVPADFPVHLSLYELTKSATNPRPQFLKVVACYAGRAVGGLEPRGRFDHFRRIGPPTWPRALHYEFLDYGGQIGVEIHLESDLVLPLRETARGLVGEVAAHFDETPVEWDPAWYRGRGRLRVLYGETANPMEVVDGMERLIAATFDELDGPARRLVISAATHPAWGS